MKTAKPNFLGKFNSETAMRSTSQLSPLTCQSEVTRILCHVNLVLSKMTQTNKHSFF